MSEALPLENGTVTALRRPIHRLDALTIAQIAAGEVVERPGSVVRELFENSVDAGARRIEVDFEQGGIELIRIVDDGHGIAPDEIALALSSHATSKLSKSEDLDRIETLGFRGEALASIGSVSKTLLQTRTIDQNVGAQATCDGGVLGPITPWTGPKGTRIEVRNLFHNTPARRKFLKAQSAETTFLMDTVQRLMLALSRLGAKAPHLVVRNHGKVVLESPAGAILRERAEILWGVEVASDLLEIEAKGPGLKLTGVIGNNRLDRATSKFQHFLVNGRCIRDKSLNHALMEGFRGLIMVGRFPVGILILEVEPGLVDVNVHPAKAEVRFRDSQAIHHLVFKAVRERLRRENIHPTLTMESSYTPNPTLPLGLGAAAFSPITFSSQNQWGKLATPFTPFEPPFELKPTVGPAPRLDFPNDSLPTGGQQTLPMGDFPKDSFPTGGQQALPMGEISPSVKIQPLGPWEGAKPADILAANPPLISEPNKTPSQPITENLFSIHEASGRFVQVFDSYLIVETDKGVMVIDQHALHERILFDQIKNRLEVGALPMQRLLLPEVVEFQSGQAQAILEQKAAWEKLGFEIESFGGGAIAIGGFPVVLAHRSPATVFRNLAEKLLLNELLPTREEMLHALMALIACHSAVRANERLTPPQMEALVEQRQLALDPNHCPHGRPTALLLSRQDLEKQFGRI